MDNCEKYTELISAGLDKELSSEELSELTEHLKICPDCREYVRLVKSACDIAGEAEEVPEGFAEGIMAKIRAEKKPKNTVKRWGTVAAAVVVAALAAVSLPRLNVGCGSAADSAIQYETAVTEESYEEEAEMEECAPEEPAEMEEAEEYDCESGRSTYSVAGEGGEEPALPFSEKFSAIGVWQGGDAALLEVYEAEQGAETETYVFVPTEDFYEIAECYGMTVYKTGISIDENAERAIVVIY